MDGWMAIDRSIDKLTNGQIVGYIDRWIYKLIDGWMVIQIDGQIN